MRLTTRSMGLTFVLASITACGSSVSVGDAGDSATPVNDSGTVIDSARPDVTPVSDVQRLDNVTPVIDVQPGRDVTTIVDATPPSDGGPGQPDATAPPVDADGVTCGTQMCALGESCCASLGDGGAVVETCATTCPDGGISLSCDGPEDCSGNPCCAAFMGTTGTQGAVCTDTPSACSPMILTAPRATRFCHTDDDCSSGLSTTPELPTCCTLMQGTAELHVCLSAAIASFSQGAATCP